MRGEVNRQGHMFSYFSPEQRVPRAHPLRTIKAYADEVLGSMSARFDEMYSDTGRPSIAPERLLKSCVLIARYSVRSDRLFCEMLDYHILFRWFLDMDLEEAAFDASTFSKNRERLIAHDIGREFFDRVVALARAKGLLSDEHFTVDGTLIEAWASLKSFRPKGRPVPPPDDPGNPTVDFHGERRSNATHQSTTDPEARLMRKGPGKEAKLSFGEMALMENRHGLLIDLRIHVATEPEPEAVKPVLERQREQGLEPGTVGADKGFHTQGFVTHLREQNIIPHVATIEGRKTEGLDARTTRSPGYAISQRIRKRIEEIFGWKKTIGGLRKSRFIGIARTELAALTVGASYNLLRLSRLCPITR
jgi:transposase